MASVLIRAGFFALLAAAQPLSAAAVGQDAAESEPTSESDAGAKPKDEKKVCTTRADTGSIMPKRICRSAAQVAEDEERARLIKDQMKK